MMHDSHADSIILLLLNPPVNDMKSASLSAEPKYELNQTLWIVVNFKRLPCTSAQASIHIGLCSLLPLDSAACTNQLYIPKVVICMLISQLLSAYQQNEDETIMRHFSAFPSSLLILSGLHHPQ